MWPNCFDGIDELHTNQITFLSSKFLLYNCASILLFYHIIILLSTIIATVSEKRHNCACNVLVCALCFRVVLCSGM